MAFDVAAFRARFPEFGDAARYPDAMIEAPARLGALLLGEATWGELLPDALAYFVAHNLALSARAAAAGNLPGGSPGASSGIVASKSVGSVSVSYDTGAALLPGAGHWNLTSYGGQYLWLLRLLGMGGIQL